jgi:DNA-binding transcriptional ArsR family regulator
MVQYAASIDTAFHALADPTRRGILTRLGNAEAAISDLAQTFEMTLTGVKKHVQVLESAGLVTTRKVGRVRYCQLGPARLDDAAAWIATYRQMVNERFDRLEAFLENTQEIE